MKWKNYGLWLSLISIVYMVFKDFGSQIDLTTWETYVTAIVGILAALGVISNPDKGKGYFDKTSNTSTETRDQVTEHIQNQAQPSIQQDIPHQNQNSSYTQEYPRSQSIDYPHQQEESYQRIQQENPNHENQTQVEYHAPQKNNTQSFQPSPQVIQDNSIQTQDGGSIQGTQPQDSMNEQTSNNKNNDRNSIHGTPAPPNEYM